mmetsp:Transcript_5451/g.17168  ORF Transcript_5451/g.17168 Transcript_5451/m.17168 type:complete len:500 (+) Transcript_5451:255-1754(+)
MPSTRRALSWTPAPSSTTAAAPTATRRSSSRRSTTPCASPHCWWTAAPTSTPASATEPLPCTRPPPAASSPWPASSSTPAPTPTPPPKAAPRPSTAPPSSRTPPSSRSCELSRLTWSEEDLRRRPRVVRRLVSSLVALFSSWTDVRCVRRASSRFRPKSSASFVSLLSYFFCPTPATTTTTDYLLLTRRKVGGGSSLVAEDAGDSFLRWCFQRTRPTPSSKETKKTKSKLESSSSVGGDDAAATEGLVMMTTSFILVGVGEAGDVGEAGAGVGVGVPGGAGGAAAAFPESGDVVACRIIQIEEVAIVIFFFGVGRLDGEAVGSSRKFGVGHAAFEGVLQQSDPVFADAFALHGFGPVQQLARNLSAAVLALEGAPEEALLPGLAVRALGAGRPLEGRRHSRESGVGVADVEEGHARFQGMSHGHAIRALQVRDAQVRVDAAQFPVHCLRRGRVAEVGVAGEELVGAFSGEDHLDAVRRGEFGEEEVRDGRPDELGVVRF